MVVFSTDASRGYHRTLRQCRAAVFIVFMRLSPSCCRWGPSVSRNCFHCLRRHCCMPISCPGVTSRSPFWELRPPKRFPFQETSRLRVSWISRTPLAVSCCFYGSKQFLCQLLSRCWVVRLADQRQVISCLFSRSTSRGSPFALELDTHNIRSKSLCGWSFSREDCSQSRSRRSSQAW